MCSLQSTPVTVTVWTPDPLVLESGDSLIMTNPGDFVSYQWFYGAGPSSLAPIPGATDGTYVITERGYYQVCVVDANGCEGCSFVYEMTCCVGIEEASFEGNVSVYPNPNNGQFTVEGLARGLRRSSHISTARIFLPKFPSPVPRAPSLV